MEYDDNQTTATATRGRSTEPAPTLTYLQAMKSALETHYRIEDDQIDLMRKVRALEDPPALPEELKVAGVDTVVQDPTITDEIARVVATLSMRHPQWAVTPPDPISQTNIQDTSTLREHFTEECFKVCGRRVAGQDTFRHLVDACVEGGAWAKLVYNPDRWERVHHEGLAGDEKAREARKKKDGPPFSWLAVDTRTVYPLWESDYLSEVMEISERPIFEIVRKYGVGLSDTGWAELGPSLSRDEAQRNGTATATFIEHWTEEWVSYYCESGRHVKMLMQFRHGYGRVPYFFAPGLVHNHWRGRKVGWGVGANKISLVRFNSFLLTLAVQSVARQAGAPLVLKRQHQAENLQQSENAPLPVLDLPMAGVLPIGTEEDLRLVELPGIPPAVEKMLDWSNQMVQHLNTPKPAANVGGDLAGAGFAIQSLLAEGKTRHHPFIESLQRLYEDATYFLWDLIETKVKETVWVRRSLEAGKPADPGDQWLGLGPDELTEAVGVRVTIDPEPATSKIVDERYVGERLQQGTMSLDQAIAYLGDNPDEVRLGKIMDRLRNEPWYVQYVNELVLRKLRRADLLKQAASSIAQGGLLPGMDPMMAGQVMGAIQPGQTTPPSWDMQTQMMQSMAPQQGFGQPLAQPPGAAPGGPIMPDQGGLTAAPGGMAPPVGPPGAGPGMPLGMGPVLPQRAMQAGVRIPGVG